MNLQKSIQALCLIFSLSLIYSFQSATAGEEERMQYISFNPSLMNSIRTGQKTATVRAGHRDYYSIGPAIAKASDGTVYNIEIEDVLLTTYTWSDSAINSEILRRENMRDTSIVGFEQLFDALKYYYPTLEKDGPVTVVLFKLVE